LCALAFAIPVRQLPAGVPADQSSADGWTAAWTNPLTPQEKSRADLINRLVAAKKSHDFGPVLAQYERMAREHPDDIFAATALFAIHAVMKNYGDCLADLDRIDAIARKAGAPAVRFAYTDYLRGMIHQYQHDYSAQAADLERALNKDPTLHNALNDLAWLRATNPDPKLQNADQALQLAKQSVKIAGRHFRNVDTLAAAYAAKGDYSRAASIEKEAITLIGQNSTNAQKSANYLKGANARLDLYTHNEPDRETPPDPPS
jgi:tetratricopeptide (TPR) repeat protein